MSVAEGPTAPTVDLVAAEEQFATVYAAHSDRLRKYAYYRLPLHLSHLAEDFAHEAFLVVWQYLLKGHTIGAPYALLKAITEKKILSFFAVKSNTEYLAKDLTDPAMQSYTGHRYAAGDPVLARLTAELDVAMERMRGASQVWRDLHAKVCTTMTPLNDGRALGEQQRTDLQQQLAESTTARDAALAHLRSACGNVGNLRAELERAGGNWRSASNMPGSAMSGASYREGSVTSDVSRTHCDSNHDLRDIENVTFLEDGRRKCRSCLNEVKVRHRARHSVSKPEAGRKGRPITTAELDDALKVLMDPANSHRTIKELSEEIGIHESVLRRRIPNLAAQRRGAAEASGVPQQTRAPRPRVKDEVVEAARTMLSDPAYIHLSLRAIAEKTGTKQSSLYNRLPVAELRRAAREAAGATR